MRNILSDKMDKMAVQFCADMEKFHVLAVPLRTNGSEMDEKTGRWRSIVSAKHAAQAAGLGTIGRNTLLLTPEYGSMVWLSVILTELALEADELKADICNNCNLCVEICPVNALESPEMNQNACWDYAFGEVKGDWRISCHRCRDICPFLLGTENKAMNRETGATVKQMAKEYLCLPYKMKKHKKKNSSGNDSGRKNFACTFSIYNAAEKICSLFPQISSLSSNLVNPYFSYNPFSPLTR